MADMCNFPLCRYPVSREGFCLHHAKHFAGAKLPSEKKKIPLKSVKRIAEEKLYKKIVKEMLAENPNCSIKSPECTGKAQGLNHKQKRTPKNFLKKNNLERSCNACNLYCETHPMWAKENGHSISKFANEEA